MANYTNIIPLVAAVIVLSAARWCDAGRVMLDGDEYERNRTRCKKRLDEGAPKCWNNVYFTTYLPREHGQCCRNLIKMDEAQHEVQNCWYYLFDDPMETQSLDLNLVRCRLELDPPAARRNGTFDKCVSVMDEGAPGCWEKMYFGHELPPADGGRGCCTNLLMMDFWRHACLAYLFDNQKSIFVLKHALKNCSKK